MEYVPSTTIAPSSGVADTEIAAKTTAAAFLYNHGKVEEAIDLVSEVSENDRLFDPVEVLATIVQHDQWTYNRNLYVEATIVEIIAVAIKLIIAAVTSPTIVGAIIAIVFALLGIVGWLTTIGFFAGLGLNMESTADIFTDYSTHSGATHVSIVWPGIVVYAGIDWSINTYYEVFDDADSDKWRVKLNMKLLGASTLGLLSLGLAFPSWSYVGSPTQSDPSSNN
ncbi:MAG: hypothetical protein ACTSP4_07030 [Candidatus Hodarchaeales archaeon]